VKRLRSTKKRRLVDTVTNADIPREDINELRKLVEKEAAYFRELNANPFVKFAIGIAEKCNPDTIDRDQYKYLNDTYRKHIDNLLRQGSDTSWAFNASTRALHVMGNSLKHFPGNPNDPAFKSMQDDFVDMYREVHSAVQKMKTRRTALEILKTIARPTGSGNMTDILSAPLVSIIEEVYNIIIDNSEEWQNSGYTAEDIITDKTTEPLFRNAVAYTRNGARGATKSISRTLNEIKSIDGIRQAALQKLIMNPPSSRGLQKRNAITMDMLIETPYGVRLAPSYY
jgi:hypothetical protein